MGAATGVRCWLGDSAAGGSDVPPGDTGFAVLGIAEAGICLTLPGGTGICFTIAPGIFMGFTTPCGTGMGVGPFDGGRVWRTGPFIAGGPGVLDFLSCASLVDAGALASV